MAAAPFFVASFLLPQPPTSTGLAASTVVSLKPSPTAQPGFSEPLHS